MVSSVSTFRGVALGAASAVAFALILAGGAQGAMAGTLPACEPSQLNVYAHDPEAAVGQREVGYDLVNSSDRACIVHGAPINVTQSNQVDNRATIGDTYFTENGPTQWIRLDPGDAATGHIGWTIPDQPGQDAYTLAVELPDVGVLNTGYHDGTGALNGLYTVTNLAPAN